MAKVLVIHGAGMNMRGKAQIDVFGPKTLSECEEEISGYAKELGVTVAFFHSNVEGEVMDRLYQAHDEDVDAAIINPAGYTTGHPALVGALRQVRFPTIEVHVTNLAARSVSSNVAPACRGVVMGFGLFGYYLGLKAASSLADSG